jgi:hypothetical protein
MFMKQREQFENGVLSVRFVGAQLNQHGVSIYDLGESLLAIQRIVHKAFLAEQGRLVKGAYPSKEEREELALQLGERRRQSDAFALVPILSDPAVQMVLLKLMDYIASGLIGYFVGDVVERIRKEPDPNKKIFIASIYKEVEGIAVRVGTAGGVESVVLGSPAMERDTLATFNGDTKNYLAEIKNENFLGGYEEIRGRVYKLYPNSNIVGIRRAGGKTVTVFLSERDFEVIRYLKEKNPLFLFKGHPVYKLGAETKSVTEFDADEIERIYEEDPLDGLI